jgi:hypothetical protein
MYLQGVSLISLNRTINSLKRRILSRAFRVDANRQCDHSLGTREMAGRRRDQSVDPGAVGLPLLALRTSPYRIVSSPQEPGIGRQAEHGNQSPDQAAQQTRRHR